MRGGRLLIDAEERMRFEEYTEGIVNDITKRLLRHHFLLQGAGGLLARSNVTTRAEWKAYCDYLQLDIHYTGILGLGFSQDISHSDLVRHIQEIRSEGYPDYMVWPAGNRDAYTSIIFLEPFDATNQQAQRRQSLLGKHVHLAAPRR